MQGRKTVTMQLDPNPNPNPNPYPNPNPNPNPDPNQVADVLGLCFAAVTYHELFKLAARDAL